MFFHNANVFIHYIHPLEPDESKQLDDDIRANAQGVESIVNIQNSSELLCIFQLFYYFNGHLSLTNGLLDSDTKRYNDLVNEKYDFDEKPSVGNKFEEQIVMDILDDIPYNHIKTEEPILNQLYKTHKQLMTK